MINFQTNLQATIITNERKNLKIIHKCKENQVEPHSEEQWQEKKLMQFSNQLIMINSRWT